MTLFGIRIQIFGFVELTEARKQLGFRVFYVDTVLPHYEDNRKLEGRITENRLIDAMSEM